MSDHTNRALILVDIQVGLEGPYWGERNNPEAEANASRLLTHWREQGWPLVHIGHDSRTPGSPLKGPGTAFKPPVQPLDGEVVMMKHVNSAFIGTNLENHLREHGIESLVICGLTTPHCVSTSVRMAANLGFTVTLPGDACATFARNADTSFDAGEPITADQLHRAALSALHNEFATVTTTDAVIAGSA
ncbi:MAG: cysteine hydrolase [Alphaproteobacteria bacterium]|nr:cysteine hydrolase [Alphaproteobacteria bacterium SS10]